MFSVPAFQFLYGAHDKALEHKRRYSKEIIMQRFSKFKCLSLNYWNFILFLPLVLRRLILKNSKIRVDNPQFNKFLDSIFYNLLRIEIFLIEKDFKTPPGSSIFGVYRK